MIAPASEAAPYLSALLCSQSQIEESPREAEAKLDNPYLRSATLPRGQLLLDQTETVNLLDDATLF